MPMDPGEIERMIKEALPDADVKLEDLVHQLIYAALQGRVGGELHALALQTSAPKT